MKTHRHIHQSQRGFTAVEMLITIIVATIFIVSFNLLFTTLKQSASLTKYQGTAHDLAYSYLRKYVASGTNPSWFNCDATVGTTNTNDVTQNPSATGQTLETGTLSSSTINLPSPITYSVVALAVYGCSGTNAGSPLRVTATVTYGPTANVIRHATYIGYQ